MSTLKIDANALFRAVSATEFKLLAYHLDLETGEVISRTLRPDEVATPPEAPSVKPLPKLGGDLAPQKNASPFGPPPISEPKKKLFADEVPKKDAFAGDFWKREDRKKLDPFGDGGFRRESGSKKLAEIFSDRPRKTGKPNLFPESPQSISAAAPGGGPPVPEDPRRPRIPVLSEKHVLMLMTQFAKESGDPGIREELLLATSRDKPAAAFERVLRKYQRTAQQWEVYFRKQSLAVAETWLSQLGVQWELEDVAG